METEIAERLARIEAKLDQVLGFQEQVIGLFGAYMNGGTKKLVLAAARAMQGG